MNPFMVSEHWLTLLSLVIVMRYWVELVLLYVCGGFFSPIIICYYPNYAFYHFIQKAAVTQRKEGPSEGPKTTALEKAMAELETKVV